MMIAPDSLTDVQNHLDNLNQMFFTCLGVIQRDSPPYTQTIDAEQQKVQDAFNAQLKDMTSQVAVVAKQINKYIDSLPGTLFEALTLNIKGVTSTEDEQYSTLAKLDEESTQVASELRAKVKTGGTVLKLNYINKQNCGYKKLKKHFKKLQKTDFKIPN
jgi:hypothetical protein